MQMKWVERYIEAVDLAVDLIATGEAAWPGALTEACCRLEMPSVVSNMLFQLEHGGKRCATYTWCKSADDRIASLQKLRAKLERRREAQSR